MVCMNYEPLRLYSDVIRIVRRFFKRFQSTYEYECVISYGVLCIYRCRCMYVPIELREYTLSSSRLIGLPSCYNIVKWMKCLYGSNYPLILEGRNTASLQSLYVCINLVEASSVGLTSGRRVPGDGLHHLGQHMFSSGQGVHRLGPR